MEMQKKWFCLFCMSAVLLGFFLYQVPVSALEIDEDWEDSGVSLILDDEPAEWEEPAESEETEIPPIEKEESEFWETEVFVTTPDLANVDLSAVEENVAAIRQNSDIFLYFVIPVFCAFFLICKFCVWFYSTFVKDAL